MLHGFFLNQFIYPYTSTYMSVSLYVCILLDVILWVDIVLYTLFCLLVKDMKEFSHIYIFIRQVTDLLISWWKVSLFLSANVLLRVGNWHFTWGSWFGEAALKRPHPSGGHDGVGCGMNNGAICRALAICGGRHFTFKGLGSHGRNCRKGWLESQERLSILWGVWLA